MNLILIDLEGEIAYNQGIKLGIPNIIGIKPLGTSLK